MAYKYNSYYILVRLSASLPPIAGLCLRLIRNGSGDGVALYERSE